ncbi:DNA translocase FtsK [Desulfitobacterium sp. Sab5]
MTVIGRLIYAFLKNIFGSLAWVIPLFCLFLAIGIEIRIYILASHTQSKRSRSKGRKKYSRKNDQRIKGKTQDQKTNKLTHTHDQVKTGIPLPKGKLVGLQGFEEYFASTEGPEIKTAEPAAAEDLSELGNDFSTYFQEGHKFSFKPLETKIVTLKGFNSYFDSVQTECEKELKEEVKDELKENLKETLHFQAKLPEKREWLSALKKETETLIPGQLAHLVQPQSIPDPGSMHEISSLEATVPLKNEEERTSLNQVSLNRVNDNSDNLSLNNIERNEVKVNDDKENKDDIIKESISLEKEIDGNNIEKTDIKLQEMKFESKAQELDPEQTSSEIVTETQEEGFKVPLSDQPKTWVLPNFELLDPIPDIPVVHDTDTQKKLEQVLADFGVQAKVVRVTRGPVITRFELAPAPGVKISRIVHLADDIALGLAARDVRIEAPIPGKAAIGIEVPNKHPRPVPFREVLETQPFQENPSKLKTALGKDISNQPVIADLKKMPHILIAGATGSGKSVCITSLINSILFNARPEEVKFLMVDPKMVELSIYNGIPHLLAPVVTDPKKAAAALKWIVKEMETRYELFAAAGVRDIERYNRQKNAETDHKSSILPWIVVIIDELADLMMVAANEVEEAICRLAQMARAAGIHLVIATQRPSVDVITGVIKANIPSRVSFAVSSQIDSRTILDATGAEKLLGKGDMLYSPQGLNKPVRVQGCFVSDDEVQRVISYWKSQGKPEYLDPEGFLAETETKVESSGFEDELFIDAGRLIMNTGMASVSFLQRKLKLGYARAARLIDLLEENGVVGGYEGSKPRQILMTMEEFEERFS